ncbi:phage terminase small subunit P27 family [Fulvimarina sp. 2208YS6-2-32]|uniref:Phage terminase small subunit P27 family n=1 Tax=Fulvimarina uroteuthidis TaxID=3098149 RepID=A0ABU5HYX9_9HYPH|nr:phage terminase small subunit P27 family [Fulvimarina sp. 2208YS6-2-32]MDY8107768.1 phage terminase small subunit P27 family [Fulvimarina sp. 2208YS6-2-32]
MRGRKPTSIAPGTSTVVELPKAPTVLSREGKAEWKRVAAILVGRRVLTDADLGILEAYCMAFSRMREAERIIARDGSTVVNAKGEHKRHPASSLQDAAIKTFRLCAGELGLTPDARSRTRFKVDDGDDSDLD